MDYPITGNVSLGSVTGNIKLYVNEGGVNNLTGIGYNNNSMTFGVNQSVFAIPEMVINQSGNVGIGTTNPIYTLDISGNVRSSDLRIDNTIIHLGQNAGLNIQGMNSVAIGYSAGETSQGQSSIAIGEDAGKTSLGFRSIAIGANSVGTGGNSVAIGHGASTSTFGNSVAIGAGATCTANNQITLGTVNQTVSIPGTTTATGLITANGGLTTSSSISATSINASSSIFSNLYLATVRAEYGYTGKAGTNGGYSNTINWHWTGSSLQGWVDITHVGTLCDYRIKENIKPALPVLDRLCSIQMFDYTHKNISICKNNGNHIGLFAHELQEVFNEYPCLVTGEKDEEHENGEIKIQSIEMPILNMILMKSIQEQNDIIKSQQKQIDLLTHYWSDFIATHTT